MAAVEQIGNGVILDNNGKLSNETEDIYDICNNNNNNNELLSSKAEGSVREFFSGTTVLVTGGTGFLGKTLLEKLLRTCPEITSIFVLVRPKSGQTVEQRHKDLLKNTVFDRVRAKWPERLEKLEALSGDVTQPWLGLSAPDRARVRRHVAVLFHSAATVRFTEPLSEALALNTRGTKYMLDLCRSIEHLKSVVHVSTAYSNSYQPHVGERFYRPQHDADSLLQCAALLPPDALDLLGPKIQGCHPNTYTVTKALGESLVQKYGADLPICVVRPSIVTAALSEPYPGWVDNVYGVTGIIMEISRGTIRSAVCQQECIVDLVPVDLAVNTCIAAAWHHTNFKGKEPKIYNCTSGQINPMSWQKFTELSIQHARKTPTKYVMMYPNFSYTTNRLANALWEVLTHYIPSIVFDLIMRAQGRKPIMMKISRRFKMATLTGEYFAMNQWSFDNDNLKHLVSCLGASGESEDFNCDVGPINWNDYVGIYLLGIRKFVLKDSLDSLPAAKRKLQRLLWVQKFLQVISGYYFYNFLFGKR